MVITMTISSDTLAAMQGQFSKLDSKLAKIAVGLTTSSPHSEAKRLPSSPDADVSSTQDDGGDPSRITIDTIAADGDGAALLARLEAIGLQNGASFGAVASGTLPASAVPALLDIAGLASARESLAQTHAAPIPPQASQGLHADLARSTFGLDGTGVTVGILSDSFNRTTGPDEAGATDTMATDIANGYLPANTRILNDDPYPGGTDEGRGMAQIVHQIAPGASILFDTAVGGQAIFAQHILDLAAAGAKVIVDDVSYYNEPDYQDGIIAQAISTVEKQGVTYLTSAGNDGTAGYEGTFAPGATFTYGSKTYTSQTFSTTAGSATADSLLPITVTAGTTIYFDLQWNQPAASASAGRGATGDLDLFLTDKDGNVINSLATTDNNVVGGDPSEVLGVTFGSSGARYLRVGVAAGTVAPTDIKLIASGNGYPIQLGAVSSNTNTGTLAGHAAGQDTIAVGAVDYAETPFVTGKAPVNEDFSSEGPDYVEFDASGDPLPTRSVRQVAFSATDGVDTSFFGYEGTDGDAFPNFYGTSAAAPSAAAVAALLAQKNPSLTPIQIRQLLAQSAIPTTDVTGAADPLVGGTGLIQADEVLRNHAPSGTDGSVTTNGNQDYTFTIADFGFSDVDGDALKAVEITTLPASGTITDRVTAAMNGQSGNLDEETVVTAGKFVSAADIAAGDLVFTPDTDFAGTTSFTFQVQDGGGTAGGGVDTDQTPNTLTINPVVGPPANHAPSGTDGSVTTAENQSYTFTAADFGFTDVDGNGLKAVEITTLPTSGTITDRGTAARSFQLVTSDGASAVTAGQFISVADIAAGDLVFTPATDFAGSTSFTFQVQDDGGTAGGGTDTDQTPNTLVIATTPTSTPTPAPTPPPVLPPPPASPTISNTHTSADTAEASVAPFSGVTIGDANVGAADGLQIVLTGGGGALSGAGLTANADGSYSLAATDPTTLSNALDALSFTPANATPGASVETVFTLTATSSAGTSATDSGTSVIDTAAPVSGPPSNNSPGVAPSDTLVVSPSVSFEGRGTFVLTGQVTSTAGVTAVEISALVDGVGTDLGAATLNGDGTFAFADRVGPHTQTFITATATDGAGGTVLASPQFSLQAGITGVGPVAQQDSYNADGSAVTSSSLFHRDGSRTVKVQASGQSLPSGFFDTFRNNFAPDNTFVFDPGFGLDVVTGFRVDGTDHDTVSLLGSDFGNSIAEVLRNTHDAGGSAVISDPTSGDTIKLAGITKAQLRENRGDFAFHG